MRKSYRQSNRPPFIHQHPKNFLPEEEPQPSNGTLQQNFNQMLTLLKNVLKQQQPPQSGPPRRRNVRMFKANFEIEPRNKQVIIDLPRMNQEKVEQNELKLWVAEMVKTVFSSAFYYYERQEMNFEQTKIFCSENIFKNIAALNQKYPLSAEQFQLIDRHLVKKVLPYLGKRYPLTESAEINKKLLSMVEEIDNIESLENNYFSSSKIVLEYRKEGNYYDIIMKVINDLLNRLDSLTDTGKTNYQEFQKFMGQLFEKSYDYDWMNKHEELQQFLMEETLKYTGIQGKSVAERIADLGSSSGLGDSAFSRTDSIDKAERGQKGEKGEKGEKGKNKQDKKEQRRKREEQEKYKASVKEYTSFLIGRKVPENVPLFSEQQISQNTITIKSPAILRMLTKWFGQLWKKFENNYFSNRTENIKLQKGESILNLKPEYRGSLDRLMAEEKEKISFYMNKIEKLNYKLESEILIDEQDIAGDDQMDETERICGKFAFKVVKNLHKEIIQYLNKVIHSILLVSKRFQQHLLASKTTSQVEKSNWPFPPNLISFKVGDLMRCKYSSRQQQIIKIYSQLLHLSQKRQNEHRFRIVRIKNRLKDSTNDILINVRFNDSILCQIQLAIKAQVSPFIKASNAFHHYIYELERSQFGPLTQLCSIWMTFDGRSQIYQNLILNEQRESAPVSKSNCDCQSYMGQILADQPFICNECHEICLHTNYILRHLKCQNCRDYFLCAKCRIFRQDFELLKNKLILGNKMDKDSSLYYRKILRDNCLQLINKDWKAFEREPMRYGLVIFIQSNKIKIKTFKLVTYNNKKYLLGRKENGQFYQMGDVSDFYFLREFRSRNILMQINEHPDILQFEDNQAVRQFILPKVAKQNYKKYKDTVVLHMKTGDNKTSRLDDRDCERILMSGGKAQREKVKNIFASNNNLTQLPCKAEDFPNLEWLVLSRNPIKSLDGLSKFTFLKIFMMNNDLKARVQIPNILLAFTQFNFLEKLVLSHFRIVQIPTQFSAMKALKCLELTHCELTNIEHACQISTLEKINVTDNNIVKLPLNLKKLKKLERLILHRNPIDIALIESCIPPDFANKSVQLTQLDLSNCSIKKLSYKFGIFSNLQTFNISSNELQSLPSEIFASMKKLKTLDISQNKIILLPDLSNCLSLVKLDISYNAIEELPSFLSELSLEEFSFGKCPIRKIDCINWLKEVIDDESTILQKYSYWYQKIPAVKHTAFDTKYSALLLDDDQNEVSSSEEEDEIKLRREKSFQGLLSKRSLTQTMLDDNSNENSEEGSEISSKSPSHRPGSATASQHSQQYTHFFKGIKKRVSMNEDQQDQSGSDSEPSQDKLQKKQQFEACQIEFQLQDSKAAQKLTRQKIEKMFPEGDMLVFDFQSKIKSSQEATFFEKQINLYHDENAPHIAAKFCQLIKNEGIQNPIINIYAGNFASNISSHYQAQLQSKQLRSKTIYNDLRKDKIPFTYAVNYNNFGSMEIRNKEIRDIPSQLLSANLQKLAMYRIRSIGAEIKVCEKLINLKISKSKIKTIPAVIGTLKMLQKLDLHENQIESAQKGVFSALTHLKIILLQQNKIKDIPDVLPCSLLQRLDLSDNKIDLVPSFLSQLTHLKHFDFSNCPVRHIQPRQWLASITDNEQALVHECQLCLTKLHFQSKLLYDQIFTVQKVFKWNHDPQDEYQPYQEAVEGKYITFFENNFNEQELIKSLANEEFLAFRFFFKTKYEHKQISACSEFKVIIDAKYPGTTNKFRLFLKKYGLENTKITVRQTDFVSIPVAHEEKCHLCQENISYPFYWLRWQPHDPEQWLAFKETPKFGCRSCVQKTDLLEHYSYRKNSILLVEKLAHPQMPADNLGSNLQPQQIDNDACHNFKCNGCGTNTFKLGEPRYLCLGCKVSHSEKKATELINVCSKCLHKDLRKDGKGKKVKRRLRELGHKHWHPYLRILFNTEGHYIY